MSLHRIDEIFRIGLGPSSSHTVGPMLAACHFVDAVIASSGSAPISVDITLYGSLAATGSGHGTHPALAAGLTGRRPDASGPEELAACWQTAQDTGVLVHTTGTNIRFQPATQLHLSPDCLPLHSNGMQFSARASDGGVIIERTYYSIGGGAIADSGGREIGSAAADRRPPYPYRSANELLALCRQHGLTPASLTRANEAACPGSVALDDYIAAVWRTMAGCIRRGLSTEGELPGGLAVQRRAAALWRKLEANSSGEQPGNPTQRAVIYAIAVNEENAAGGRVVTAPTNGAAGIVPAVLQSFLDDCADDAREVVATYLLTTTAIATLYKMNASISGAEVGCQGEVGSAASMAAAGLAAVMGGSPEQIENAAEIAMEHCLGLTCDPIGGLVQIPCIERNAMGAVKAITAANLALAGDGSHLVSLDNVIETMRATGRDMSDKYKETARGGLAITGMHIPVSTVEC